jgi:hypothetical protein
VIEDEKYYKVEDDAPATVRTVLIGEFGLAFFKSRYVNWMEGKAIHDVESAGGEMGYCLQGHVHWCCW